MCDRPVGEAQHHLAPSVRTLHLRCTHTDHLAVVLKLPHMEVRERRLILFGLEDSHAVVPKSQHDLQELGVPEQQLYAIRRHVDEELFHSILVLERILPSDRHSTRDDIDKALVRQPDHCGLEASARLLAQLWHVVCDADIEHFEVEKAHSLLALVCQVRVAHFCPATAEVFEQDHDGGRWVVWQFDDSGGSFL